MHFVAAFHLWPFLDTVVSYLVAFVLGTLIGAERQYRQRTAGLRTNALVALGYDFNSLDQAELAKASDLLMEVRPHLYAIDSDYQPAMRTSDAWMTMCWSNDASQLHRDVAEIAYVIAADGGEIWTDYYAIPKFAHNKPAAHALINHLLDPDVAAREHLVHGGTATDRRVRALLPDEILANEIIYPDEAKLTPLEFGLALVMTDPNRAEIMNRFRAARG